MKLKTIFNYLIISILTINYSFACDVCGCANGGSFFGLMPQSHLQYVGIRYRHKTFDSHLNSAMFRSQEVFQTAELWGRFYPFKRTQLVAFVPYNFNEQTVLKTRSVTRKQGLGDVSALLHYNLYSNQTDTVAHRVYHTWLVGGGVKLPTGKFAYTSGTGEVANPNFQLGTGSLDYLLSSLYTVRTGNWGLSAEVGYKINQANKNNYQFANRFTAATILFRTQRIGNAVLLPSVGLFYETSKQDKNNGEYNGFTGGYVATGQLGLDAYVGKWAGGVAYQKPINQLLAKGELAFNNQLALHLTRLF